MKKRYSVKESVTFVRITSDGKVYEIQDRGKTIAVVLYKDSAVDLVNRLNESPNKEEAIKHDFLQWSGGFEPESDSQIGLYCGTSLPGDLEITEMEAGTILTDWMHHCQCGHSSEV